MFFNIFRLIIYMKFNQLQNEIEKEQKLELNTRPSMSFRERVKSVIDKAASNLQQYYRAFLLATGISFLISFNSCGILTSRICTFETGRLTVSTMDKLYLYTTGPDTNEPGNSSHLITGKPMYREPTSMIKASGYRLVSVKVTRETIDGQEYWVISQPDYLMYKVKMDCVGRSMGTRSVYFQIPRLVFNNGDTKVPVNSETGRIIQQFIEYKKANPSDNEYIEKDGPGGVISNILNLQIVVYYEQISKETHRLELLPIYVIDLGNWKQHVLTGIRAHDTKDYNRAKMEISEYISKTTPDWYVGINIRRMRLFRTGTYMICCPPVTDRGFEMGLISIGDHKYIDDALGLNSNSMNSWVYVAGLVNMTERCSTILSPCATKRQPPIILYGLELDMKVN